MKHKHHIIPKHIGGSNDPSNLVELSVEDHAEAHRILWEQYGRWQDKIAWQTLSGHIGIEEAIRESQRNANLGRKVSDETRLRQSLAKKGKKQRPEVIEKRRLSLLGQKRNFTEEWKENISKGKKGQVPWIKGKNHTKETIEKNRIAHLGTTYNRGRVFEKVKCEYCNNQYAVNVINRHSIICKEKQSSDNF